MRHPYRALASLLLLVLPSACSSDEPAEPPAADAASSDTGSSAVPSAAPETPRQPIDTAATGAIRGVVRVSGDYPRRPLAVSSTPGCSHHSTDEPLSEFVVAENGLLANTFVWVKKGLDAWELPAAPDEPVVLDQRGCMYTPHVVGVQAGQPLHVKNSDPATHNVNAQAKRNQRRNQSQSEGAPDLEWVYDEEEVWVKFACDIHPWMSAYVGVVEHPFFAVSDAAGSFEIEGLPAGTYELEAVHENRDFGKRGKVRQEVTVVAGETTEVTFQMD